MLSAIHLKFKQMVSMPIVDVIAAKKVIIQFPDIIQNKYHLIAIITLNTPILTVIT